MVISRALSPMFSDSIPICRGNKGPFLPLLYFCFERAPSSRLLWTLDRLRGLQQAHLILPSPLVFPHHSRLVSTCAALPTSLCDFHALGKLRICRCFRKAHGLQLSLCKSSACRLIGLSMSLFSSFCALAWLLAQ